MNNLIMIVITATFTFLAAQGFYFLWRNEKVCGFLQELNHKGYSIVRDYLVSFSAEDEDFYAKMQEYAKLSQIWDSISSQLDYNEVLHSLKPLKPEYWLTDEQLDFLSLYKK